MSTGGREVIFDHLLMVIENRQCIVITVIAKFQKLANITTSYHRD